MSRIDTSLPLRRLQVAICVVLVAAATALLVATAQAAVTLSNGHVDVVAARMTGGKLRALVKDETKGRTVWRDPREVTIAVGDRARTELPSGHEFIGREGQPVWVIPQAQRSGTIWSGWSTEALSARQIRGDMNWRLTGVSGPGRFALFQSGSFGEPSVIFTSTRRLPQNYRLAPGSHGHGNWVFTARGTYRISFTINVTTRSGMRQSATATVVHRVG